MIKQLRRKFIMSAIISVAVVLALLMLVVNVINYVNIYSELDEVTQMIIDNDGKMPNFRWDTGSPELFPGFDEKFIRETPEAPPVTGDIEPPGNADGDEQDVIDENSTSESETVTERQTAAEVTTFESATIEIPKYSKDEAPKHFNEETSYATRFFSIVYDEEGNLISCNMDNIATVTDDDAGEYVQFALSKGEGKGNYGDYRYNISKRDDGSYIAVFLNASSQFRSASQYILFSIIAFVVSLVLAAVLILIFSKKAIQPTIKAMEQQKQFITNASHELKTPLTVMSTNLKLLEMDMGKQKWIDKTEQQVQTLTELINGMVVLSRLDEEHPALIFTNFNISDMVEQIADEFSDVADSTGHAIKAELEPDVIYHGDQMSIRRMISVLFDNAFKYSTENGDIKVKLYTEKKYVVLKISNGCSGVDENDISHLFERFYRVDQSHSKETKGFGIGLSIVRSVAENHHGFTEARLLDSEHIEFTVYLKALNSRA